MNKKHLLSIAIFTLFGIIALNLANSQKAECKKYSVSGIVIIHKPYCGGARPTEEIAKGIDVPYKNQTFYIVRDSLKQKPVAKFTTNEQGEFSVKLRKGKYFVYHSSKMTNFNTFYQKFSKKANTKAADKSCFEKWYNTPEYSFVVKNDLKLKIVLHSKCFTGLNPCLQYTGPMPQ